MTRTIERQRPKLGKPILREVCLVGDPSRRYVHSALPNVGQGLPCRVRTMEVGRQGKPCPTP